MSGADRLGYVDWMRGLAVLLMMQTHVYDSWLTPEAKQTPFHGFSRLIGGYPAPLFLFLAGLSLALLAEARLGRGRSVQEVRREALRRGLEVFGYAALFRLWMFTTSGFATPADLLRVDVLNCIGVSMLLVTAAGFRNERPRAWLHASALLAAGVGLLTPLAWDWAWPAWIPRPLLAYVSGRAPGAFFPLFPWAGFTAAGAAVGFVLARAHASGRERQAIGLLAPSGAALIPLGLLCDRLPQVYPRYDFWWTSPSYFMVKVGIVLLVLGAAYAWGQAPWAARPSLLRELGRSSLFAYWVHIEIVYGGIVAPAARARLGVPGASLGLALMVLVVLVLSRLKDRALRSLRRAATGVGF